MSKQQMGKKSLIVLLASLALSGATTLNASTTKYLGAESGAAREYVVELAPQLSVSEIEAVVHDLTQRFGVTPGALGEGGVALLTVTLPPADAARVSLDPRVRYVLERATPANAAKTSPSVRVDAAPRTRADLTWSRTGYQYDGAGNIRAIGSDVYTYDKVGRLTSGSVDGPANTQVYTYDPFGNRLTASPETGKCVGGTDCAKAVTIDSATNHLIGGAVYDDAGSLVSWEGWTYQYDASGMTRRSFKGGITSEYLYDADDERLGTWDESQWHWTIRDLSHNVVRELSSGRPNPATTIWNWESDHIYRGGSQLLASESPTGSRRFHLDHLGTPRLITDGLAKVVSKHSYYPFGSELNLSSPEQPEEHHKFTGHERDLIAGGNIDTLDYMHARFYGVASGKFFQVDPAINASAGKVQSWNRYSYALNNPMLLVDKNGQWPSVGITTHQNAIDFSLLISASDRSVLKDAQGAADRDQEHQYKHAMRNPGQSRHDAAIMANKFIDAHMQKAIAYEKAGKHSMALTHLGFAMHTLQDATSPTHMGFQEFDPSKSNTSMATISHVEGEATDPSGVPQYSGLGKNLDRATYDAYAFFAQSSGLPAPQIPECDGNPCFDASSDASNAIHLVVPSQ